MVSIECSSTHHEGVTLVTAGVTVTGEPTHVTVTNCLDGPVCPPRREGRPVPGWTEEGFEGVLAPGRHALGYAVDAPPADPPARLDAARPVSDADPVEGRTTPAAIVGELGDPSPPADAVPDVSDADGASVDAGTDERDTDTASSSGLPPAVTDWLDSVQRRLDRLEQPGAAHAADADTGRVDASAAQPTDGSVPDERTLRQLARRADRLADRRGTAGDTVTGST